MLCLKSDLTQNSILLLNYREQLLSSIIGTMQAKDFNNADHTSLLYMPIYLFL